MSGKTAAKEKASGKPASASVASLAPAPEQAAQRRAGLDHRYCRASGGGERALKELRKRIFSGRKVKALQPAPDGAGLGVVEW